MCDIVVTSATGAGWVTRRGYWAGDVPRKHGPDPGFYEAIDRADAGAALAVFSPEVEFDLSHDVWGGVMGGSQYRGLEGVQAWWGDLTSAWEDDMELHCEEVLDAGREHVISVATMRGRGRASGIAVEHAHAGVWAIRDEKVVRVDWFSSRDEALEAAGLTE